MPRKASEIRHISQRDISALRLLLNTNHAYKSLINLTDNRLKQYEKLGYMRINQDINNQKIISLTSKGRTFALKLADFRGRKAYVNENSASHNCHLAEIYSKLTSSEQENWRNESEIRHLYSGAENYSTPDGVIFSSSGEIETLIEVITDSYGALEIELKETFAQNVGADIKYYKI